MKTTRPPLVREKVLSALITCADPMGATHSEIVATCGLDSRAVTAAVRVLKARGQCFSFGADYFFASEEARDLAAPLITEQRRKHKAEMTKKARAAFNLRLAETNPEELARRKKAMRERSRKQHAERVAKRPAIKAAKPVAHPFKPLAQPKPRGDAVGRKRWADQEAIKPPGLIVMQCPGYTGASRYETQPGFKGEFMREFEALRNAA